MLQTLVIGFFLSILVFFAVIAVLIGVFSAQLRRRNRVDPNIETLAPITWLWAPTQAPRLHRRLQNATNPMRRIDQIEGVGAPRKRRDPVPPPPPAGSAPD